MKRIDLAKFKSIIEMLPKEDLLILDVRTESEYNEMHINLSENIPLAELADQKGSLLGYETIVVHCAHGFRARQATQILTDLGFSNTMYVDGNIEDWVSTGLDVVQTSY